MKEVDRVYIPNSSDKTKTFGDYRPKQSEFTSLIVQIKRNWSGVRFVVTIKFTSLIVQIKPC